MFIQLNLIIGGINDKGYGVTRIKEAKIRMALMQEGASSDTYMSVDVENSDNFRVEMIQQMQLKQ